MHFKRFVLETKNNKFEGILLQIIESIKSQKLEKTHCLYRGFLKPIDPVGEKTIRQFRKPLDTSKVLSTKMDEEFVKLFNKPIRSSTTFATFSPKIAMSYTGLSFEMGNIGIVVPKAGSKFYASSIIPDMTQFFYDLNMDVMLDKIGFSKDEQDEIAKSVGMKSMDLGSSRFSNLYMKIIASKNKNIDFSLINEVFKRTAETYKKFSSFPPYNQYKSNEIMIENDSYYYVKVPNYSGIDTYANLLVFLEDMKKAFNDVSND
jgi:hypothetical protein